MKQLQLLTAITFFSLPLFSQNVGIGTVAPQARLHVTDSNVIFSAAQNLVLPTNFTLPVNGAGTRLIWMPTMAAFRVGEVTNNSWDADSIGYGSVAMGANTRARGSHSFAMGTGPKAYGINAVALGNGTTATGNYSTATGINTHAFGERSTAMGSNSIAGGIRSLALGESAIANGSYSISLGLSNGARAYGSVAMGIYADSSITANPTSLISTDPLLYLGNGTNSLNRHNTLVVYKDGNLVSKNPTVVLNSNEPFNVPVTGIGTRLFWSPQRSAFRVGTVTDNQWDFMGPWSFATGYDTRADGNNAVAFGLATNAVGNFSTTFGVESVGTGTVSTAFGYGTQATAYGSFSLGRFNNPIGGSNPFTWVATDPLLIVGNGSSDVSRNNAMVVYKNGDTDINGYTRLGETANNAPAIKMKKLTGISAATQGALTTIPHGLTRSKIIGVQVLLTYLVGAADIPASYLDVPGYEYNWQINNTDINIYTKAGNSANILGKAIRVLVTYEE